MYIDIIDMNATTSQLLISGMLKTFNESLPKIYQMFWDILVSLLTRYWIIIVIVLIVLLIISFLRALSGRWGMFASVVYNYLYFGIVFVIGWVFGAKIFTNPFIDIFLFILYVCCYTFVGKILRKFQFR